MTIGWGVIGAGGIADRRTIPEGLAPSPRCRLVAVMDSNAARARAVADKYGVPHCLYREQDLLALPEVEAVYIATPNYLAAAKAGKHILVEKPLALTVEQALEVIAACRQAGVKLATGLMMRFHAHHRRLKAMIDEGQLGQLVFGRAQLTCWYPPIAGAWRQDPALGGGGALMDMGIHCLDLLEMLMGRVTQVAAFTGTLTHAYTVDDSATVMLRFASGAQAVVDVNFNIADDAAQNMLEVHGTVGAVIADHTIGQDSGGNMVAYLPQAGRGYDAAQARLDATAAQVVAVEPVNIYRAEVEHLVECIERDLEPQVGAAEGLRALQITLLAYEAAQSGRTLDVP